MPVSQIAGSSSAASGTPNAFSSLSSEEFMRIIMTELGQQDPLKPNDTNQMVQELSAIRSIQSDIELVSKLDSVVTQNQLASAGALIGAYVTGLTDDGFRASGVVVSVSRTADGPVMNLENGERVRFENVDQMRLPPENPSPAPPNPAPTDPPHDDDAP